MRFDPNEAKKPSYTFPIGRYRGVVENAAEEISKSSGKPMAHFTLKFSRRNPDGSEATVYVHEYARFDLASGLWTMEEICKAVGKPDAFASGDTDAVLRAVKGATLEAELDIQEQQGYPDKNTVSEFIERGPQAGASGGQMRSNEPAGQNYGPKPGGYDDYATKLPQDDEPPF